MKQEGFSLIELMVAIGILVVISTMIFASYPELSQRLALKRTSEEIALIARQAQAYSLGIERPASGGSDYYGFGIHFDKSDPKSLILFADSGATPNKTYDAGDGCGGSSTECFQKFTIDTGDYISELNKCDKDSLCSPADGGILDIIYPRATSIATINKNIDSPSYARITIKSPRGGEKYIKIWRSGQISVE